MGLSSTQTVNELMDKGKERLGDTWDDLSEQDIGQARAIVDRTVYFVRQRITGELTDKQFQAEMLHVDAQWKHVKCKAALKVRKAFWETLQEWGGAIGKILKGVFGGFLG
jgi:hypothetical protein